MNIKKFHKFNEAKIQNIASKYLDYYYLDEDVSLTALREIFDIIDDNSYRAVATFSHQIQYFEDFGGIKIALLNYPPERHTKRNFKIKFDEIKQFQSIIDEVEFPWDKKYLQWGENHWRNIVLESIECGFKLRPMLEIGIMNIDDIKITTNFLKDIGIRSIVTSTGLIQEITTIEKWEEIKDLFPSIFETKVIGLVTLNQLNQFIESDIDLAATTISISTNYNLNDNDIDYFGDNESWLNN